MKIKNIAELKRFMTVGQSWELKAYWPDGTFKFTLGVRPLGKVNSVGFAFTSDKGLSYCDWPKASELIPTEEGFKICKPDFITLKYDLVN